MHLLSTDATCFRLIAILNKILCSDFPHLDRSRIGLESDIDHIRWWAHPHAKPLNILVAILETISMRYINDIALRISDTSQLTDLGMMGYAMLTSSNLERAIRIACQALDEADYPVKASLTQLGNYAEIEFTNRYPSPHQSHQAKLLLDIAMLSAWRYCQAVMIDGPNATPEKILIHSHEGAGIDAYKSKFNCPVQTGAKRNAILIKSKLLASPIPTGNPQILTDCNSHMHQLLRDDLRYSNQISDRVRTVLYERTGDCAFNLESTAKSLNMSRHQLRRQLLQAGASFRQLSNEVRMDLARQYLTTSPLSIKQIAYQLSYSEPNNFIRAFTSNHGCSPSNYRKIQLLIS